MIRGWLIYNREDRKRNNRFIDWFLEEAENLGIDLSLRLKEDFVYGIKNSQHFIEYKGEKIALPKFAIVRNVDTLFTKQLEYLGIKTFNTSLISQVCNDKAKTHQYLALYNIPMVDTIFINTKDFKMDYLDDDYPKVVKVVNGRGGKEVYGVYSKKELENKINSLEANNIIIQKMGEVPGKDLRVFVIGKTIIGAVLRSSNTDFRANFSLGGTAKLYNLSESQKKLIYKIIDLFDFGMVGIDFIFDKEGNLILNEIEDVVGSRTLCENSDINIVRLYLEHIKNKLEK